MNKTFKFIDLCFIFLFYKRTDLQFKQYKTDDITPKLYFETIRFSAFYHQWVLKARVNDNQKNPNLTLNRYISYQLILKSKLSGQQPNLEVKFCVLKGPFGEVMINPRIQTFEFNQSKTETEYIRLNIKPADCNKLLASKIINFRIFMFQPWSSISSISSSLINQWEQFVKLLSWIIYPVSSFIFWCA